MGRRDGLRAPRGATQEAPWLGDDCTGRHPARTTSGQPPALEAGDIKLAQRLIQDPDVPAETICERLGIFPATLYQYVAPDGSQRK
jgi:hypothetical protein